MTALLYFAVLFSLVLIAFKQHLALVRERDALLSKLNLCINKVESVTKRIERMMK